MGDERTIEQFHAARESGSGCPEVDGGKHYFAFIDSTVDYRICIDCGAPEEFSQPRCEHATDDIQWGGMLDPVTRPSVGSPRGVHRVQDEMVARLTKRCEQLENEKAELQEQLEEARNR